MPAKTRDTKQHAKLTPAERRVLNHRAHGSTNAQVAEMRGVSIATVRAQLKSAYVKLGATNITEAINAYQKAST